MAVLLSVIIPCYNHGKYIREAIQTVLDSADEHYPYEIIIVNDGSTDEYTIETLGRLAAEGYTVIHQQNMGLSAARNTAIRN